MMIYLTLLMLFISLINNASGQTVSWKQDPSFRVDHYNVLVNRICNKYCTLSGSSFVVHQSFGTSTRMSLAITSLDFNQNGASLGVQLKTFSLTSTQYSFLVYILNQTVLYNLNLDLLTFDSLVTDYYLAYGAFNCTVLNKGEGYRSQNYTKVINSAFNFQSGGIVSTIFPLGYIVFNPNGSYLYLNWKTYVNISHYTIIFQTNDKNTIEFINFHLIAFDSFYMKNNRYIRYLSVGAVTCPGIYCLGTGAYTPGFKFQDANKQFWGMSGFNFTKNQQIKWYLNTISYSDMSIGYVHSVGISYIKISGFISTLRQCLDFDNDNTTKQFFDPVTFQCAHTCVSPYIYPQPVNQICAKCHFSCITCSSPSITSCLTCSSANHRYLNLPTGRCYCQTGYTATGAPACKSCLQYMTGCLICTDYDSCSTCQPDLQVKSNLKGCECIDTNKSLTASGQCIDLKDCLNYVTALNGTLQCVQCDIKKNLFLYNFVCNCKVGFQQSFLSSNNTFTCQQVCGNGKLTLSQFCDDGNFIEGDGCNSACVVQSEYRCFAQYTQTSFCLRSNTTLTYYGSLKDTEQQNMVEIYFSLSPFNQKFIKSLTFIQSLLYSSLGSSNKFTDLTYNFFEEDGQFRIVPRARYLQKVNASYEYFMSFQVSDSIQKESLKTSATFKIQSKNYPLYLSSGKSVQIYSYILLIVVIIAYLLAFISILAQSWIGVELIQFFQITFFYCFFLTQIDAQLADFINFLKLSTGFNTVQNGLTFYKYYDFNSKLFTLGYSQQFILNFNYSAFAFSIPLILLITKNIEPMLHKCFGKKKKKISRLKTTSFMNSSVTYSSPLQNCAIFSIQFIIGKLTHFIVFIFLFQIILSFSINLTNFVSDFYDFTWFPVQLFVFGLLLIEFGTLSWLYIQSWRQSIFSRYFKLQEYTKYRTVFSFKRFNPSYPLIYTSFQLTKFILFLSFINSNVNSSAIFIMISFQAFYLLFFIFHRPYNKQRQQQKQFSYLVHNLHNIWNALGLIVFLIIVLKCNQQNDENIKKYNTLICLYILTVFIGSLIFTFIRLFLSKKISNICTRNYNLQNQKNLKNKYEEQIRKMNRPKNNSIFKVIKGTQQEKQNLRKQLKTMKKQILSKVKEKSTSKNKTKKKQKNKLILQYLN